MVGALDVITGSTGSDLVYTRVNTADGRKRLIVPVTTGEHAPEIGGKGYNLSATWNRTELAAKADPELKVKTAQANMVLKRKNADPTSAFDNDLQMQASLVASLATNGGLFSDDSTLGSLHGASIKSMPNLPAMPQMATPVVPKRINAPSLRTTPATGSPSHKHQAQAQELLQAQRLMSPVLRLQSSLPFKLAESFVPMADSDSRSIDPLTGKRLPRAFVINESASAADDLDMLFNHTV